jgi:hypothetical protein
MAATQATINDASYTVSDSNITVNGGGVADRWWVDDDADGDWNNPNNWSSTEGGIGGAGVPTATDHVYFSDTSSSTNCTLSANSVCASLQAASADTGGVDDYTGILDISTFNLTNSGVTKTASGFTLKIGVSADTGLTTAGITFVAGSWRHWQTTSKIFCSGNWVEPNSDISTNTNRGDVTITGSIQMAKPSGSNYFYNFTLQAGNTITATSNLFITGANSGDTVLDGTIAKNGNTLLMGCPAAKSFTVGVNGDVTGAGNWIFVIIYGATLTSNRVTAFSHTGLVANATVTSTNNLTIPAWDFSNANVQIRGAAGAHVDRYINGGTLKCKSIDILSQSGYTTTVRNDLTNPNIWIYDSIDFNSGVGTVAYNKGTGTISHLATSGTPTCDFNGKSIEDLVINNSGVTSFTNQSDFTTDSFTLTNGKFNDGGYTLTVNGNIAIAAVASMLSGLGKWIQAANGTISNPLSTNQIGTYEVNADVTLTNDTIITRYFILKTGKSVTTSSYRIGIFTPIGNDPIDIESGATYTGNLWLYPAVDLTQKVINQSNMDLRVNYYGNKTVTATGNLTLKSLMIHGFSDNYDTVDMDTYNLTCIDLYLGIPLVLSGYLGYIKFGSGTHSITNIIRTASDTSTTHKIDFESSTINIAGNVDLTGILSNDNGGTSTMNMVQSSGTPTCNFDSKTIENLVINNSGVTSLTNQSDFTAKSFTLTDGNFTNTDSITVTGNVSIANTGSQTLYDTGLIIINANADLDNDFYQNSFDLQINDGFTVDLTDRTWLRTINLGNSTIKSTTDDTLILRIFSSNFWTQHVSSTISCKLQFNLGGNYSNNTNISCTNGFVITPSNASNDRTFTQSGNINCNTISIYAAGDNHYMTVNLSGNLTATGLTTIGTTVGTNRIGNFNLVGGSHSTVGITITLGIFDFSTYNVTSTAKVLMQSGGTLKGGVSSGTGLTINHADGIEWESGGKRDWQTGTKINCAGDWTEPTEKISTTNYSGTVRITGDCTMQKASNQNYFYSFRVDVTKTLTAFNNILITAINSLNNEIYGIIAIGGSTLALGGTGNFTIGVDADITGSGYTSLFLGNVTWDWQKTTTLSKTGALRIIPSSADNPRNANMFCADVQNCDVTFSHGSATNNHKVVFDSGTLICRSFTISTNSVMAQYIMDLATNDPNIIWYGNINLAEHVLATVTVWNKGDGTITFNGTSGTKTVNLDNQTVEDIVVNCSGAITENSSAFTSDKITMQAGTFKLKESVTTTITDFAASGGTLQSASDGTLATINLTNLSGTVQNTTFKDLKVLGNIIDAKDKTVVDGGGANTNTNNGNCLGRIFFNDILRIGV